MSTIGGIRYPSTGSHLAGELDGMCCETCVQEAYDACRDGTAIPVGDEAATIRFQILALVHVLAQPLELGAWRRYMFTGVMATLDPPPSEGAVAVEESEITRQIGYTRTRELGINVMSADYALRMAMAYLNEYRKTPVRGIRASENLDRARNYIESARTAAALEAASNSFVCYDCEETITGDAARRAMYINAQGQVTDRYANRANLCLNCLHSSDYTHLPHQGMWVSNDVETVSVEGISGPVSLDYAQENFRWVEPYEDSEGDDVDGYWSTERGARGNSMTELLSYAANPFDHFTWDSRNRPNALVFGVELEMEPTRSTESGQRGLVTALGGNIGKQFLLKSDGSLNNGVELVTMPFTLAQHLDGSGVPWKAICDSVADKARSGANTTACGIHIHINKKALSALTIGKMLVFLNDPGLAPLITAIAQRASGSYCTRSAKKLTDGVHTSENRYDIMNVSVRHPTCEIRMFRGNLTVERIYKNIEFCHALIQYCRQASMRTLADWGNFSSWLIAHRGQYPNLVRFLVDKGTVGFRQLARETRDGQIIIEDR